MEEKKERSRCLGSDCERSYQFEICILQLSFRLSEYKEVTRLSASPSVTADTLKRLAEAGLDPDRLPAHVAIIMDGNGRWARQRGHPRIEGHRRGVESVRSTIEEGCRLGLNQLTLYCLSSENWKRPATELEFLMALLEQYLIEERAEIMEQNIR